jgi:hypothetical protein
MITKVGGVLPPEGRRLSPQWLMANGYQRPVLVEGYSIFERRWAKLKHAFGRAARHHLNKTPLYFNLIIK